MSSASLLMFRVVLVGFRELRWEWVLVKNLCIVDWWCLLGSVGGLKGIVHGAGNAMLMRGGACAAELRLMGVCVSSFCVVFGVFKLYTLCVVCFRFRGGELCLCVSLDLNWYVCLVLGGCWAICGF